MRLSKPVHGVFDLALRTGAVVAMVMCVLNLDDEAAWSTAWAGLAFGLLNASAAERLYHRVQRLEAQLRRLSVHDPLVKRPPTART